MERTSKEGGSGAWKRGQSADRKSRASTSTSTSSTTTAKSRKFFDQWKQAASMSKLGNRTKNLLGKWKSHSQSVDIVLGNNGGSGPATPGGNAGMNASGIRITHDGLGGHHGVMGSDPGSTDGHAFAMDKQDPAPQKGKAQWSEHVWSKKFLIFYFLDLNKFFIWRMFIQIYWQCLCTKRHVIEWIPISMPKHVSLSEYTTHMNGHSSKIDSFFLNVY